MNKSMRRQPHAALDVEGRRPKAEKIRHLLDLSNRSDRSLRMLEIGTGSGAIAHYFATCADLDCKVDAVDVVDQRQVSGSYGFRRVDSVALPFEDDCFDVVISNHVLEHVGDAAQQAQHLREVARVLGKDGVAYLASPNRWQLVEPHYHLAFLSWLPRRWRTPYLSLSRKGSVYDCEPLRMKQLEAMLSAAGLAYRNICIPALRHVLAFEKPGSLSARCVSRLPDSALERLRGLCPTHVYLLRRGQAPS